MAFRMAVATSWQMLEIALPVAEPQPKPSQRERLDGFGL
jgi:hypothetical protein